MPRYPFVKDIRLVHIPNQASSGGLDVVFPLTGTTKIVGLLTGTDIYSTPPRIMDEYSQEFIKNNYALVDFNDYSSSISWKDKVMLWQRNIKFNLTQFVPNILGHIAINELENETVWVWGSTPVTEFQDAFLIVVYF